MWVPQPTGMDASVEHFSEARALRTAAYLSEDIGFRLVGDLDEACILPQAQLVRVHACVRIQRASARHGCILQVSTPEVETAAQYLLKQAHELKRQADATRPDLVVEVRRYYLPWAMHARKQTLLGHREIACEIRLFAGPCMGFAMHQSFVRPVSDVL